MSSLHNILSTRNFHQRDSNVLFEPTGHKYTITTDPDSKYTSVNTWNHFHFPKFNADEIIRKMMISKSWKEGHKYWGVTTTEIKNIWNKNRDNAASAGTNMHYEIECFMNNPHLPENYTHKELYESYIPCPSPSLEWNYFLKFVKDYPNLKPFRTEWMIYSQELKLAGSIDMVYENPDGTLSIYDWKRALNITKTNSWNKTALTKCISHLHDTNFWHYALQLNTYKAILEKNYGKKVTELYLVKLHPDNTENTYELLSLPILEKEIKDLFEERKKNFV